MRHTKKHTAEVSYFKIPNFGSEISKHTNLQVMYMNIQIEIDVGILIINRSRCVIIIVRMCTPERGNSEAQKRHQKEATATPKRGNSDAQKNAMA